MLAERAESWRGVVKAVHNAGGAIVPQLWHCGASVKKGSPDDYESPSGLQGPGVAHSRVMTEADIEDTIGAYAEAARLVKDLGFDGVEVHAGHGYLPDLFFWAETNKRTDRWGGATLPERARFPLAVMRAVRAAVGPDFLVSMRISQWKSIDSTVRLVGSEDELVAWLAPFRDAGVDLFNTSQFRYDEPAWDGANESMAAMTRRLLGVPTVVVGSVGLRNTIRATAGGEPAQPQPVDDVARRLEAGEFDLVAVGRGLLADPDWAERVRSGSVRTPVTQQTLTGGL
jgi:2,4-dienoyl-CoA reductase-like NADH-dependent reductase (Old Yellow Enzyme family)